MKSVHTLRNAAIVYCYQFAASFILRIAIKNNSIQHKAILRTCTGTATTEVHQSKAFQPIVYGPQISVDYCWGKVQPCFMSNYRCESHAMEHIQGIWPLSIWKSLLLQIKWKSIKSVSFLNCGDNWEITANMSGFLLAPPPSRYLELNLWGCAASENMISGHKASIA